ncbi:UMP-CMP kinase 2, mitochondrial [Discoglossus pictus]
MRAALQISFRHIFLMPGWSICRPCLQLLYKRRTGLKACRTMAGFQSNHSANWKQRLFAVDADASLGFPDPFYFTSCDFSHQIKSVTPDMWPVLSQGASAYSVSITTDNRIRAARLHQLLGQDLTQSMLGSCKVLRLFSYHPHNLQGSLEKGFIIIDPLSCPSTENKLRDHLSEYAQHIRFCSYQQGAEGDVWQCRWALNGQATEIERTRVVRVEKTVTSPFVANIKDSAVFYSMNEARTVLQECSKMIPEASYVLELMEKCSNIAKKGDFPIIVIEGLDATGKTTLTQSLKNALEAELLKSPPDCISQWRKAFDDEPSLIKRAYYALGNYITASQVANASKESPVIVDRYWHSTAAYAIATEIGGHVHNLPEYHHDVYQWPEDLLKPDLVILLTVSDEERILRIRGRGLEETKEEKELEANCMFRQKVEEAYTRMENPGCVVIDAGSPKEAVLEEALSIIKKHCDN